MKKSKNILIIIFLLNLKIANSQVKKINGKWYYYKADSVLKTYFNDVHKINFTSFFCFSKKGNFFSDFGDYSQSGKYNIIKDTIIIIKTKKEQMEFKIIYFKERNLILQNMLPNDNLKYLYFFKKD
ncbi:MAG: hypothetical protein ACK50A_00355 [Sphingobacteriaceae bacterium]